MFTSQVRGTGGLLKLDLAGNQLAKYGSMRTDWIDLAADHCSMYYSDEGPAIHRYDVCTNKPLTDFVANLGVHIYALRILPNQTVLAATGAGVQLFDASGKRLSLYPKTGFLGDPFALNLDPDGVSFWTAALAGHTIFKFAIAPAGPPILTFDRAGGSRWRNRSGRPRRVRRTSGRAGFGPGFDSLRHWPAGAGRATRSSRLDLVGSRRW